MMSYCQHRRDTKWMTVCGEALLEIRFNLTKSFQSVGYSVEKKIFVMSFLFFLLFL